jgi:hypothetical protein
MTSYTIDAHGMLHLPDGLTVGGGLYLSGTAITALPEALTVGGGLDLIGTAITALPDGIRLGGKTIVDAPHVADLDAAVFAAASQPGALDMSDWHCGTAHCWAGWITTLAGDDGLRLDNAIGTANAAMLIYSRSCPGQPLPDFYCKNDEALADMARRAGRAVK